MFSTIAPDVDIFTISNDSFTVPLLKDPILPLPYTIDRREVVGLKLSSSGHSEHVNFFTKGLYEKFGVQPHKNPVKCRITELPEDYRFESNTNAKFLSVGREIASMETLQALAEKHHGMVGEWDWDGKSFALCADFRFEHILTELNEAFQRKDIVLFFSGNSFGKDLYLAIPSKKR